METRKPTHAEVRRVRYSLLPWPSLYPTRFVAMIPLAGIFCSALAFLIVQLNGQASRERIARAEERARAIISLKLSGLMSWQWQRSLACEGMGGDCLRARLAFREDETSFTLKTPAPEACRICHTRELEQRHDFYIMFDDIPAGTRPGIPALAAITLPFLLSLVMLGQVQRLRGRRRDEGLCVVAFESTATPANERFMRRLASRAPAFYSDRTALRFRFVTAPDQFRRFIRENAENLASLTGGLRSVALYAEFQHGFPLPVETLRAAYQFLKRIPEGKHLIQEKLAEELRAFPENGRRLVFKNKSGALLRFVAWGDKENRNV